MPGEPGNSIIRFVKIFILYSIKYEEKSNWLLNEWKERVFCMKKLVISVIIIMFALSIGTPIITSACSGSNSGPFHFTRFGHSNGSHFTSYQISYSTAHSLVFVTRVGQQNTTAHNGAVATSRVSAAVGADHAHRWW